MESKTAGVATPDGLWNLNKSGAVSNGYNLVANTKYYFDINAYGTPVAGKFTYVKVTVNDVLVSKFNVAAAPAAAYRVEYTPKVSGVAVLKIQSSIEAKGRDLYLASVNAIAPTGDTTAPIVRFKTSPGRTISSGTPAAFQFSIQDAGSGVDTAATQCIMDGVVSVACTSPKSYPNLPIGSHSFLVKAFDKAGNSASTKAYAFDVQGALGAFSISSVTALSASSLQVAFGASAGASSYAVKYGTAPGVYTQSVAAAASPVVLSGLASGQKYYVMVVANSGVSTKNANAEASASTNAASTALGSFAISSVQALSTSALKVNFGASANAASYTLKYGTVSGSYTTVVSTNAVSPATITGLESGKTYYVMVTAVAGSTSKNADAQASGTTQGQTQGSVLNFDTIVGSKASSSNGRYQFGDYWLQTNAFQQGGGMFVDGAAHDGLCGSAKCPANNTGYYSTLNDGNFYLGRNSGANFKLRSMRAAYLGTGRVVFPDARGVVLLWAVDSNNRTIGDYVMHVVPGPDYAGEPSFSDIDLGKFADVNMSYLMVATYVCDTKNNCFRSSGAANFAFDDLVTVTEAAATTAAK